MRHLDYTAKLVAACSLTLALAGVAGSAHATQSGGYSTELSCELNGYMWSDVSKSCADKPCLWFGGVYYPGETTSMKTPTGYVHYFCDGFTGKMTTVIKTNPTLPRVQLQPQGSLTLY